MLGTLCLLDMEPRTLNQREVRLLEAMADDLMSLLRTQAMQWVEVGKPAPAPDASSSATVGQLLPSAG